MEAVMAERSSASAGRFPTTHWSRVARAGVAGRAEADGALAELCAAYWYPIYALVRRLGHGEPEALDLTQEYFARLLEKPVLAAADQTRGRFRAFLRTDFGYFLAGQRDRDRAWKRGGNRLLLSIDIGEAETRYAIEPVDTLTPERLFDRAWAFALLGRALDALAAEYTATERGPIFERLQGIVSAGLCAISYAEVARELGMSEAAVQQAASRLRKRYREALRAEIAAMLEDPTDADVDSEIRDLFDAVGR
jgi:RNA polymerase sigma factor (sigma-70 family)